MINHESVKALFTNLETNNADTFFQHVADDVNWTVMGTHPLAGVYTSKESFLDATFRRLNKILKEGVILKIQHVFVDGQTAVVEMTALSTMNNGKPFSNVYCWVVEFDQDDVIKTVRAYLDSALVQQAIDENE